MRLSDAVKADKDLRRWRKAISLSESVSRRLDYYRKHKRDEVRWSHEAQAKAASWLLWRSTQPIRPAWWEWDLVVWGISALLSSRIMQHRVRDVMAEIFKGLPQPRPAQHNDLEQQIIEDMNDFGQTARANSHKFLLMCEIAYRMSQNWFMIFNTLTVDRDSHDIVFNKDSRAFYDYTRRFDNAVRKACSGSTRKATETVHTYFACVEEGGNTGRLHIHVLHFCKQLPLECLDPNRGLPFPRLRELDILRPLWPYGFSTPVMVRYSPRDAYGLAGYRWPLDHRTGETLTIGSPFRVSSYIAKYITKGYNTWSRDKLLWRVRKSQRLGHNLLQMCISELSAQTLLTIARDDTMTFRWNRTKVPSPLLRLTALKRYHYLCSKNPSLSNLTDIGKQTTPRLSPLQSLRASTRAIGERNRQNSIHSTTDNSLNAATSEQAATAWLELQASAERVDREFFATTDGGYGTTSNDDYALYSHGARS